MKWLGILALAVIVAMPASAAIIYDNGPLDDEDGQTSEATGQQVADNFTLSEGQSTITDIHWWGHYGLDDSPETDTFRIVIYGDDGGLPGATVLFDSVVGTANRTDTGDDIFDLDLYSYSVDISPLELTAGTIYWLSIVNDTSSDADDQWHWLGSSGGVGGFRHSAFEGDWLIGGGAAFQLTNDNLGGDVVPEPATMLLLGLGVAGLAYRSRQR